MGKWGKLAAFMLVSLATGCTSMGPHFEPTPLLPLGTEVVQDGNPVYIPLGHQQYGLVFETCLQVLNDYQLEIQESNRYDGRIEARPRIAPGVLQLFKPGSPDMYERVLATAQTYRQRVSLAIQPADNGGYFIEVQVRKELEDLQKPVRSTVGGAVFRSENNVERQFEVIDPVFFEPGWLYKGRDVAMEQELIRRLTQCLGGG